MPVQLGPAQVQLEAWSASFANECIYVTPDEWGMAECVVAQLKAIGVNARLVTTLPKHARQVLLLDGLVAGAGPGRSLEVHRRVFQHLSAIAPTMEDQGGALWVVCSTGGIFGLDQGDVDAAWVSGLSACVKTASIEWPKARVQAIDLPLVSQDQSATAEQLIQLMASTMPVTELAVDRDGRAWQVSVQPMELMATADTIEPNATWLVSGGARGITAACVIALAKKQPMRWVLCGRTPYEPWPEFLSGCSGKTAIQAALIARAKQQGEALSPKALRQQCAYWLAIEEITQTCETLRSLGSQVRYVPVDLCDQAAVVDCVASIHQTWGCITGIVHGAGLIHDRLIKDKTVEQFEQVFNVKVAGLSHLLQAVDMDRLTHLIGFSSVAGRYGNQGQIDYAAGNEVINKVLGAIARSHTHTRVVSINWGPWAGGMVTEALQQQFQARGIPLLSSELGTQAFVREVFSPPGQMTEVVYGPALAVENKQAAVWTINHQRYPYLVDHQIDGVPLVPLAQVMITLHEMMMDRFHSSEFYVRQLSVHSGIRMANHDSVDVLVTAKAKDDGQCHYECRSATGHPAYSLYSVSDTFVFHPSAFWSWSESSSWPVSSQELYEQKTGGRNGLRFGPSLHSIAQLVACDQQGGVIQLRYPAVLMKHDQGLDAAVCLLDGLLQSLVFWQWCQTRQGTVPMGVGHYWLMQSSSWPSELMVEFRATRSQSLIYWFDARLIDAQGRVWAELHQIKMVVYDKS